MFTRFFPYKKLSAGYFIIMALSVFILPGPLSAAPTPSFIENQGQLKNESVKYYLRGSGFGVYFAEDGVSMELNRAKKEGEDSKVLRTSLSGKSVPKKEGVVIKSTFVGAQKPTIVGEEEKIGKVNYFLGKEEDWRTKIPTYGEVFYKDLYPNIDLRYMSTEKGLKYQFEVRPGGDPKAIRVALSGVNKLSIDPEGNLVMHTELGEFKDVQPVTYQEFGGKQKPLRSRFVVFASGEYGFYVEKHDPKAPLIVDPGYAFATLIEGTASWIPQIALDSNGQAVFTTSYPGDPSSGQVARLSADGKTIEAQAILPFWGSALSGIAVDSIDFVYISTEDADKILPGTLIGPGGGNDVALVKLSPDLSNIEFVTYIGGGGDDGRNARVAVDDLGNVYLAGQTFSVDFPVSNGSQLSLGVVKGSCKGQPSTTPCSDVFISKLSVDGASLEYSTFLGGSDDEGGFWGGVTVDPQRRPSVGADTWSDDFPTLNMDPLFDTPCSTSGRDGFAAKLNPDGNGWTYQSYLRCAFATWDVGGDSSGNMYLTGFTRSSDFRTTPGVIDPTYNGGEEVWAMKLGPEGNVIFSTFLGGETTAEFFDHGHSTAGDDQGNMYVSGTVSSPGFATTTNALDRSFNGGDDGYVVKISPDGSSLLYGTFMGGIGNEETMGVVADANGSIFAYGFFRSDDFAPAQRCITPFPGLPCDDTFIIKIDNPETQAWVSQFGGLPGGGSNDPFIATDSSGNVYVTGVGFNGIDEDFLTIKYDADGNEVWRAVYDTGDSDVPTDIAVDSSGNVYVTGFVFLADYFISTVKYDPNGNEIWAKLSNAILFPHAMTADASGNVYVTGSNAGANGSDIVLVKYDSRGRESLVDSYDGGFSDVGRGVATDSNGNIYVSGRSYNGSDDDIVTFKVDKKGNRIWDSRFDGGFSDFPGGVGVDSSGNVYVGGTSFTATDGEYVSIRYDSSGNQIGLARYNSGLSSASLRGFVVDSSGNTVLTGGKFNGRDVDIATVKFDPSGNQMWEALSDNPQLNPTTGDFQIVNDISTGIALDIQGNVYITGWTTNYGLDGNFNEVSMENMITIKYGPGGSQVWEARYDSLGGDFSSKVAVDSSGNAYVVGISGSGAGETFTTLKYTPTPVSSPPPPGGDVGITVSDIRTGVSGSGGSFTETSTFAQGDTVTFRTTVVDENGQPVACDSAEITITGPETPLVSNGPCNANGVVDVNWNTSRPKKSNPGTATGAYSATATDVTAAGFVFDGISPTVNFDITP